VTEIPVDYELVRTLRERVADEMTRVKQHREARGEPELSTSDEQQLAMSLITAAVQRHQADLGLFASFATLCWPAAGSCRPTPATTCG
jgi:hypothetical protein